MVSSQVKEPLVFNNGQYLQVNSLLHSLLLISLEGLLSLDFVLVEAHTKSLKDFYFGRVQTQFQIIVESEIF